MVFKRSMMIVAGLCAMAPLGCKSSLTGTYSDANGAVILELRSGGKANLTFMGDVQDCSYQSGGKQLALSCKGDSRPIAFAIHDDGSLTGPPGSMMPPLRKEK